MKIAYRTTDEVNEDAVRRLAANWGADFFLLGEGEPATDGPFDLVVYDLDCLPQTERRSVLAALAGGRTTRTIAVHSFGLDDGWVVALRARGIIVCRRLVPGLIERGVRRGRLRGAFQRPIPPRKALPSEDDSDVLPPITWKTPTP